MAVKGDGSETEVVLFAARPVCCSVLFAAASTICTSRTRFVVEPDSAHFRQVFYLFGNFSKKDIAFIFLKCLIGAMNNTHKHHRSSSNRSNRSNRNENQTPGTFVVLPRRAAPGCHYKLAPSGRSLAMETTVAPEIDRQAMSARAVISTATIDRVQDLLIPRGCRLENYQKNPVVLWGHGLEGISQPIGTSRDPTGNLAVTITDDEVRATSWFSQTSLAAAQIFELIDEGIVRATSVRETPLKSRIERHPHVGDILIVEEWELEEWSWCAIGVNPDAVAKTLHRNRLGGQPIISSIVKSLTTVAPVYKRFGIGLPTEKVMTDPSRLNEEPESVDLPLEDPPTAAETDESDADRQPYGSTVVSAVHTALTAACQNIEDAIVPLENPTVKEGLNAILISLQEQIAAIEGLHSSSYPDQPSLKSDDGSDGQEDEAMKAFLASGRVASLQVLGLGARLKGLIGARNLTTDQRRTLNGVSRQLGRLVSQSKSYQCDNDEAKIAALEKSIHELTGLVGHLRK